MKRLLVAFLLMFSLAAFLVLTGCIEQNAGEQCTKNSDCPLEQTCVNNTCVNESQIPHTANGSLNAVHELHEWGVIAGCVDSNETFVTSRPKQLVYVKQPVIYLHADNGTNVKVEVKFKNGLVYDTYPNAKVHDNMIMWDVLAKDKCKQREVSKAIPMEFVPLEEIKDQLNDVDASCVVHGNTENKFLFYEGEMDFEDGVEISFSNETATIKNNRKKPIYDARIIMGKENPEGMFSVKLMQLNFGTVNPGEEKTAKLENLSISKEELSEELEALGFTTSESKAFSEIWYDSFFEPSNMPFMHLVYRLDQDEYDEMFPLTVHPKPEKTVRAMYVLIKMD